MIINFLRGILMTAFLGFTLSSHRSHYLLPTGKKIDAASELSNTPATIPSDSMVLIW